MWNKSQTYSAEPAGSVLGIGWQKPIAWAVFRAVDLPAEFTHFYFFLSFLLFFDKSLDNFVEYGYNVIKKSVIFQKSEILWHNYNAIP